MKVTNTGTITIDIWTAGLNHRQSRAHVIESVQALMASVAAIWRAAGNEFTADPADAQIQSIGSVRMVFTVAFDGHDNLEPNDSGTRLTDGNSAEEMETFIDALLVDLAAMLGKKRMNWKMAFSLSDESAFEVRAEIERRRRERDKTPKFITMFEKPNS